MSDILNFISDPAERRKLLSSTLDVLNRGVVAGTLGAPVDLMNLGINAVKAGYGYAGHKMGLLSASDMPEIDEKPVGGSEWIAEQMQKRSLLGNYRNPTAEILAGGLLAPLAGAAVQARAPQIAAGLLKMQENASRPSDMRMQGQRGVLLYHGTPNGDIAQFAKKYGGTNVGGASSRAGHWFSDDPHTAVTYAGNDALPGYSQAREFIAKQAGVKETSFQGFSSLPTSRLSEVRESVVRMIAAVGDRRIAQSMIDSGYLTPGVDHSAILRAAADRFMDTGRGLRGEQEIANSLRHFFTDRYARHFTSIDSGGAPSVQMRDVNLKNPMVVDMSSTDGGHGINKFVKAAKAAGNDGVIFKQIADGGPRSDHYVVFDNSLISDYFK